MTTSGRPFCWPCRHYRPSGEYRSPEVGMSIGVCAAYPQGIPAEIAVGLVDHREPHDGDNGVRFEANLTLGDDWRLQQITEFLDAKVAAASVEVPGG